MSDYGHINPAALDRHITGNYGENQFPQIRLASFANVRLEEVCPACEGDRQVQEPNWAAWFKATGGDESKAPMPEPEIPEEIPCPDCEGQGVVMTQAGAVLFDFVRRRLPRQP